MPRKPIKEAIQVRIYTEGTGSRRPSPTAIAAKLELEFGAEGPAPRTVKRYLEAFKLLPESEQEMYRQFRWPESMPSPSLPWEAAPAALEMLRHFWETRDRPRPLVVAVKWFWRVTLAAPDAPYEDREAAALQLAASEVAGGPLNEEGYRRIERWLTDRKDGGALRRLRSVAVPPGATWADEIAIVEAMTGRALSWQAEEEGQNGH